MQFAMEPQFWRTVSQVVIFFATGLGLIGSIGLWYFNARLEHRRSEERQAKELQLERRTIERDSAIAQVQSISALTAELDSPVTSAFLRVILKDGYLVTDMADFRVFFELSPFNVYYDLQLANVRLVDDNGLNEPLWGFTVLAGPPNDFAKRPFRLLGQAGPPPGARLQMFSWELFWAVRPKLKLRDLHHGAVRVALPAKHLAKVDYFEVDINRWIVIRATTENVIPHSRANPVVDVPNKDDFVTLEFFNTSVNGRNYPESFGVINLFDGNRTKVIE